MAERSRRQHPEASDPREGTFAPAPRRETAAAAPAAERGSSHLSGTASESAAAQPARLAQPSSSARPASRATAASAAQPARTPRPAASAGAPRRPKLHLPFENRREDAGVWAYDHRAGLCVTLIVYLVLMIAFVSSKIVIGGRPHQQGMYIDLQTLAELEQERDRLQAEVDRRQQGEAIDWGSIRNEISNENALNEQLKDDRGTNAAALNDAAEDAAARMQANREAYEQGLAEAEAIGGDRGRASEGKHEDRKVRGSVTVSFSLTDPLRQSVHLNVPAYRCESGGQVVVAIVVNRAGEVISARVVEGGDDCMREAALRAANISTFNIDPAAPARHQGTITYTFIPQY